MDAGILDLGFGTGEIPKMVRGGNYEVQRKADDDPRPDSRPADLVRRVYVSGRVSEEN